MDKFEFAFTLFGLVLGLAITAVLSGFVGVLKARSSRPNEHLTIRIGWLTPLLAFVVISDLITFWLLAWNLRDFIAVNQMFLTVGAVLSALYFVVASLIFPDDPKMWPNLDDWFDRHKGQIGAGIGMANIGYAIISSIEAGTFGRIPLFHYAYVLLMLSLVFTRRRSHSMIALVAVAALLCWSFLGLPVV